MQLSAIEIFLAVARAGGFAAVAKERNLAPSSISRAVQGLEEDLGVRLFNRTTRAMTLTEAGQLFLLKSGPALEELMAAKEAAQNTLTVAKGHLKLSASVAFGNVVLMPLIKEFREKYPDITLELLFSDAIHDLIAEGIDIAFRHGQLLDSTLVCKRFKNVQYHLVASPDYLKQSPQLKSPADLSCHHIINYALPNFREAWQFKKESTTESHAPKASTICSSPLAILNAAKQGMGVALLADWLVNEALANGELTRCLGSWQIRAQERSPKIWLVRPSKEFVPAKVQVFERFVFE